MWSTSAHGPDSLLSSSGKGQVSSGQASCGKCGCSWGVLAGRHRPGLETKARIKRNQPLHHPAPRRCPDDQGTELGKPCAPGGCLFGGNTEKQINPVPCCILCGHLELP